MTTKDEWQPIQTAPANVRVLVYDPDWVKDGHDGVMEAKCGPYGWGDPVYTEWHCEPTHWRPLPSPPKGDEKG